MLPAHGYPGLKKYAHLKGNFGTAWQNQQKEFADIPAPVLFTTNCLMPPQAKLCRPRVHHGGGRLSGSARISARTRTSRRVIEKALALGGYAEDTGVHRHQRRQHS